MKHTLEEKPSMKRKKHLSHHLTTLTPLNVLLLHLLNAKCSGGTTVAAKVGEKDKLLFNCTLFQGENNLLLVWEKEGDNGKLQVHKFMKGQDDLSEQDPQYRGRTSLFRDQSQRNLLLTLTDVTDKDGGNYYCRGASEKRRINIEVTLSITDPVLIYNISSNCSRLGEDIAVTVQFSGEESHVTWELDGGRLPERYRLIDDNRTVIIPSAQRDDAGRTLRVRVTNPVSEEVWDHRLEINDYYESFKRLVILGGVLLLILCVILIYLCHSHLICELQCIKNISSLLSPSKEPNKNNDCGQRKMDPFLTKKLSAPEEKPEISLLVPYEGDYR